MGVWNHVILKVLSQIYKMLKTAWKILFIARVMIYWRSWFAYSYYSKCKIFKLCSLKMASMYLLERNTHPKVLKLDLWLHRQDIYKSNAGIFFGFLWAKKLLEMAAILEFWALRIYKISKIQKKHNSGQEQYFSWRLEHLLHLNEIFQNNLT